MSKSEVFPGNIDMAWRTHARDIPKPWEDYMICDPENQIFVVLDGITRIHQEYFDCPDHSAACEVNAVFASAVMEYLAANREEASTERLLREAVRQGNRKIAVYREKKSLDEWGFYPGTLGIIAVVRGNRLHYLCNGDCIGLILRGNSKICFGEQLSLAALENMKVSKADRYRIYCNHPENELSYTIFNGDECVPETCEYAWIDLYPGDSVVLASDGIKNYMKYESVEVILNSSAEELIARSVKYDVPPFATYSDDKSVMKFWIRAGRDV